MTHLGRVVMGIGSLVASLAITGVFEFVVLSHIAKSQLEEMQAAGVSAPGEGVGFDLGPVFWALGIFILVFPIALTLCWLTIVKTAGRIANARGV